MGNDKQNNQGPFEKERGLFCHTTHYSTYGIELKLMHSYGEWNLQMGVFHPAICPEEIERKNGLETKALRRQLVTAQLAAKYPSLANHMHRNDYPYSRSAQPYGNATP